MGQVSRISKNNTTCQRRDDGALVSVVLHATEIFKREGNVITLNCGGYVTATTKARLTQIARQESLPFAVYRKKGTFYAVFGQFPEAWDTFKPVDFSREPVSYNLETGQLVDA